MSATIHGRDVVQELTSPRAGRHHQRGEVGGTVAMGAYLELVTPGIPMLGAWIYQAGTSPTTTASVHQRLHQHDAHRRLPGRRPARGDVCHRARDGRARQGARHGPGRAPAPNFIRPGVPEHTIARGLTIDSGDYGAHARQALELLDYDAIRADSRPRRDRGDAKQIGVGLSTYIEMCGLAPSRMLGALRYAAAAGTPRRSLLPTGTVQVVTGSSPHGQGHETSWRRSSPTSSASASTTSRCSTATPRSSRGHGHLRQPRSLTVGGIALAPRAREGHRQGPRDRCAPARGGGRGLEFVDGTFTVKGAPTAHAIGRDRVRAYTAHDLPDGMEPGLEARGLYDPPNFTWPVRRPRSRSSRSTRRPETVELVRYVAVDDVGNQHQPA